MSFLDIKGEVQMIQADEMEEFHSLSADETTLFKLHSGIQSQKT